MRQPANRDPRIAHAFVESHASYGETIAWKHRTDLVARQLWAAVQAGALAPGKNQRTPGVHLQLRIDARQVVVHCLGRNVEASSYLLIGKPLRCKCGDPPLLRG